MLWREGAQGIPGYLAIVMRVVVDEAWADGQTTGVNGERGGTAQFTDFGDFAVPHSNIAAERRHAGTVHDQAILDQQIVCHLDALLGFPFGISSLGAGPETRHVASRLA